MLKDESYIYYPSKKPEDRLQFESDIYVIMTRHIAEFRTLRSLKGATYFPRDDVFDVHGEIVGQILCYVSERHNSRAILLRVRRERRFQRLQDLRENLRSLFWYIHE